MAEITFIEKVSIENLLGMASGYVLDFSDRTFRDFVGEFTGLDIDNEKYHYASNSKANRLRQFFKVETNDNAGKLLKGLCDYWLSKAQNGNFDYRNEERHYLECLKISERLKGTIVENIDAIKANWEDNDFKTLAKEIRGSIEKNQPEVALDRLHTFVMKYTRQLCDKHNINYSKDEALHSIFGKYLKFVISTGKLESEMSQRILKTSISNLDSFNDIRNNKSFAHDNSILNYEESVLIFNNISNMIKFLESFEGKITKSTESKKTDWDNLDF